MYNLTNKKAPPDGGFAENQQPSCIDIAHLMFLTDQNYKQLGLLKKLKSESLHNYGTKIGYTKMSFDLQGQVKYSTPFTPFEQEVSWMISDCQSNSPLVPWLHEGGIITLFCYIDCRRQP
jgi:uncharacterized protein YqiB (DUF1249 family)